MDEKHGGKWGMSVKKCKGGARQLLLAAIGLLAGLFGWLPALQAQPGITSPAPGSAIAGDVPIFGSATIDTFQKYEVHFKQDPSGDDAFIYFAGGTTPVANGQLGIWQAGALPPGTYTLRLRVVKADGNYAEFFVPNLSVNLAPAPVVEAGTPTETPTVTPTFTPAPQPTAVLGEVSQPQVEGDEPTPLPVAVEQPAVGGLLPTPTPASPEPAVTAVSGGLTRELGEALAWERLQDQFWNGVRLSAGTFLAAGLLIFGRRLLGWAWQRFR
jgi:hypothetical protein